MIYVGAALSQSMGIDLSQSNLVVTAVQSSKGFVPILDSNGERAISNTIFIKGDELVVGANALQMMPKYYLYTLNDFLNFIGMETQSPKYESLTNSLWDPKRVIANSERRSVDFTINFTEEYNKFAPEELVAISLLNARDLTKKQIGYDMNEGVISYPSIFNEIQRRAIANSAGIIIIRYIKFQADGNDTIDCSNQC